MWSFLSFPSLLQKEPGTHFYNWMSGAIQLDLELLIFVIRDKYINYLATQLLFLSPDLSVTWICNVLSHIIFFLQHSQLHLLWLLLRLSDSSSSCWVMIWDKCLWLLWVPLSAKFMHILLLFLLIFHPVHYQKLYFSWSVFILSTLRLK